jgi:hypothetical protein
MSHFARTVLGCSLLVGLVALPHPAPAGFMQSYQATGNLGLDVSAVDNTGAPMVDRISGTFMLSQVPIGATIQKAFVYTNDWMGGNLTLTLNTIGQPGPGTFTDMTSVLTLTSYRWDVTTFLQMQPVLPYAFSIQSSNSQSQIAGAALFVVWQDPSAPLSTVTVVDGARIVGETAPMVDTESATFNGLPAGLTSLSLFTVSDDMFGTGETVRFNGGPDHGPLDGNLGSVASLLQFSETSQAGNNTVSISSGNDIFGWLTSAAVTPVPEPASFALLFSGGVCGLAGRARRRRNRPLT